MRFWQDLPEKYTILAPMEGVTDLVFRQVVARAGRPDVFFTEFTNVDSFASERGRANALERLKFLPEERPIVAQIWGKKPDNFAVTARGLVEMGYVAGDINMGCPDKNVVRNGGGAALIRPENRELVKEIIQATKVDGLAVSVKTRLGYSKVEEWRDWLKFLLEQGLEALTVHLRTKKEMSKVGAHFELIPEIVALRNEVAPDTKLNINGDIKTVEEGMRLAEEYGFEGVMVGRGVFENPFVFRAQVQTPTREELIGLLEYHLDLFELEQAVDLNQSFSNRQTRSGTSYAGRPAEPSVLPTNEHLRKFEPLKRFFKIYVRDFPGANEMRARMMEARDISEVRKILEEVE